MKKIGQSASFGAMLSIIFVWFTSQFGSGWATGMNTLVYFAGHGWSAMITPFFGMGICAFVSWVAIEYARLKGVYHYRAFMESLYQHKVFGIIFDIIQILSLPITVGALSSGFASAAEQYMGLNYWLGVLIFSVITILGVIFGEKIVRASGSIMGVAIIVILVVMFVIIFASQYGENAAELISDQVMYASWGTALWWGVKFAMLTAGMCVTLLPIMRPLETRKDTITVAVGGYVVNLFYILILNYIVLAFMPEAAESSVPILYAAQSMEMPLLTALYVAVLILAIITTSIGIFFSYITRFKDTDIMRKMKLSETGKSLLISFIMIAGATAVSAVGLQAIIAKGYSYMSYFNTPLVCAGIPLWGTYRLYKIYKTEGDAKYKAPEEE